jgi:DNA-directed RNA polymerase subunit RPC12/RpoP
LINNPQQQQLHNESFVCQNCFIKLNELDEHQVIADRIKLDLLNAYNYTHRLHFPDVKVKIEHVEASPDVDQFDEDLEENFIDMSGTAESDPEIDYVQVERIMSKKLKRHMDDFIDDDKPRKKKRGPRPKGVNHEENIITHFINGMTHYQCKICGRTVKKRAQIKQHIQIHTNERNICCQDCGMMCIKDYFSSV